MQEPCLVQWDAVLELLSQCWEEERSDLSTEPEVGGSYTTKHCWEAPGGQNVAAGRGGGRGRWGS